MRAFDLDTTEPLHSVQLFKTGTIHGIIELGANAATKNSKRLLIWGGRSVCIVQVKDVSGQNGVLGLDFHVQASELSLTDWILDACCDSSGSSNASEDAFPEAFLVTSHNALLSLSLHRCLDKDLSCFISSTPFAWGPQSMLYSAHLINLDSTRLLVASGTVFGEVLVWTCQKSFDISSNGVQPGRLAFSFSGHEGSVFGVRIADSFNCSGYNFSQRFVVSCSDDRTIRIWDISKIDRQDLQALERKEEDHQTGFGEDSPDVVGQKSQCLATAMGHASRIWGVRLLSREDNRWQILSYGEDASSHIWLFDYVTPNSLLSKGPSTLKLEKVHEYHAGKNIWAVATKNCVDSTYLVTTGGADGRIVLYTVNSCNTQSLEDISVIPGGKNNAALSGPPSLASFAFAAMQGNWDLYRVLKSQKPAYPSGVFRGTATLASRSPSDRSYDGEYLYSEEGILTTEQGLSLKGSRHYVYRYQSKKDIITAWFVKPDDNFSVDYLFHLVEFQGKNANTHNRNPEQVSSLTAAGHHLCVNDQYDAMYVFHAKDSALETWSVKYDVKGPEKDYYADATYSRNSIPNRESSISSTKMELSKQYAGPKENPDKEYDFVKHKDLPKIYIWIAEHELLATTIQGRLVLGKLSTKNSTTTSIPERLGRQDVSWIEVAHIDDLASKSLMTSLFPVEAALLSGKKGIVYLYIRAQQRISPIMTLPGKVSAIFSQELSIESPSWRSSRDKGSYFGVVITCLGSQTARLFILEKDFYISELASIVLPLSFIVTTAHWIEGESLLALGSRDGKICVYDTSNFASSVENAAFPQSFHVHNTDAVTIIQTRAGPPSSPGTHIFTAGRDGKFAVHRIVAERDCTDLKIDFETLHISTPPFGPNIEGAHFDEQTNDLSLWGFRSTYFVVWNSTRQQEVVAVNCGGVHRNWAYRATGKGGSFVWTKASTCNIHLQTQPSHIVLQAGGHGREIKTMAFHRAADGSRIGNLLVTGSEDTTIRVYSVGLTSNPPFQGFKCELTLHKHTTGVQRVKFSPSGTLLFSAGGREEFFVWRVSDIGGPGFPVGIMIDGVCPPVTPASDLRIMDFDVVGINRKADTGADDELLISMVYSDSTVRVSLSPLETLSMLLLLSN